MAKKSPIINILTYKLPYELTNQIYNEFHDRLREANYLIDNYRPYKTLKNNTKTVESILSLSIFHRRVITNLDGAVKFYATVTKKANTDTVKIGSYNLTFEEKNKILAVVLNYNQLIEKFSIPPFVMEYYETKDFLKNILTLKSELENANSKTKKTRNIKDDLFRQEGESSEEEIPF